MHFHWFLPTAGDSHGITSGGQAAATVVTERPPDIGYLALIARAVESLGFEGVLTPTGTFCEDAWLTTAALIGETSRLKFLVAFRPGILSPTLAAQMASTYQRISGGRLMLNIVTGGESTEQRRFGDYLDHDKRYERTESEGQRRMAELANGDSLEVAPNLWAGFGLVRPGAGTALVGSHAEVAERLAEYRALGIDHFIMSGQPHLEEAYRFGENVLPLLTSSGVS
jgi:alkanesulfonate monooxygenase SsuD/methylene tetrahydromethanopterin reductase-like flavin-dependent oxidoreductase (luciferase family)